MARTIPDGYARVVLSGSLANGAENFAFGYWIGPYEQQPTWSGPDLDILTASAEWTALMSQIQVFLAAGDSITSVDGYYYQGNEAIQHAHKTISVVGAATTAIMPCQIAVVMTLRTALATRSGRGRMFIPVGSLGLSQTTRLPASPANINTLVDKWAALFSATPPGVNAVVVSQTHGLATPITSVDADIIPDTQRRRRNRLIATRHSAAVT